MQHRERHAVHGRRSQTQKRLAVLGCAVALVGGKAIARIVMVERFHHAVALGLGDDRRGGDAEIDAIALVERVLRDVDPGHRARVHEHVLRRAGQRLDGATHGEQRRMVDVDAVDLLDRRHPQADARRLGANLER